MAAVQQYSKIIIKRSTTAGELPTMGVSSDHTDGSWSATDIYVGEYFYNVVDARLWIGGTVEPIELMLGQLFELTYAEAELQKTIVGSPSGDGLIIGALYKITDKGDGGIILTAIDLDKFSFYGDELIASPAGQRACIYDFDADLLTYPSGALYKVYSVLLSQSGTDAPVVESVLENTIGTIVWSYSSVGIYIATATGLFTYGKTAIFTSPQTGGSGGLIGCDPYIDTPDSIKLYTMDNLTNYSNNILTNGFNLFTFEIRVYN